MPRNFIGPPVRDFNQLFVLAENELVAFNRDTSIAADLVAICVFASQGSGFYCCSMEQYRHAMEAMRRKVDIDVPKFLARITPKTGFRKGQVPKFDYRSCHRPKAQEKHDLSTMDSIDFVMLETNWGLAQIPGWVVAINTPPGRRIEYLQNFLGDVNFQMRVLIDRYTKILDAKKGDREEALQLWFHMSGYYSQVVYKAARVMELADELRSKGVVISSEYKV